MYKFLFQSKIKAHFIIISIIIWLFFYLLILFINLLAGTAISLTMRILLFSFLVYRLFFFSSAWHWLTVQYELHLWTRFFKCFKLTKYHPQNCDIKLNLRRFFCYSYENKMGISGTHCEVLGECVSAALILPHPTNEEAQIQKWFTKSHSLLLSWNVQIIGVVFQESIWNKVFND